MTRQTAVIMHSQQVARSQCSSCKGGTVAAYRLRPLHRPAPLIRCAQRRTQNDRIGRSGASVRAQAQSEKKEQEASASAQESTNAQRDGQADNVATPLQEQLPNQQEVTMKMSPEDLASLKDAIKRQKGGGGDDINFVEGILEEVRLISWPAPLQALRDTVVVIAIVLGTAVTLFSVNTVLADISKQLYEVRKLP